MSSNKKRSRKAKILPQFSLYSGNKPPLDLLEIQRKSFCDLLERGIINELSKTDTFRETAKFSGFTQELELAFNPDTYQLVSPNCTPKEAILKGKTYACKLYVQATLTIRFSPRGSAYSVREGKEIEKQPSVVPPFSPAAGAKKMQAHYEKNSSQLVETTKKPQAALSTPLPFKYSKKLLRYLQSLQPAQPTVSWTGGDRSIERLPIASNFFENKTKIIKRPTTTFIGSPIIKKVVVLLSNKIIDRASCTLALQEAEVHQRRKQDARSGTFLCELAKRRYTCTSDVPLRASFPTFHYLRYTALGHLYQLHSQSELKNNWSRQMHTKEVQEKAAINAIKKNAFSFVDSHVNFTSLPHVETPAVWNDMAYQGIFADTKFFDKKDYKKWNRVKKYPVLATPLSCIKSSTSFEVHLCTEGASCKDVSLLALAKRTHVPLHRRCIVQVSASRVHHKAVNHIRMADSKFKKQFVCTEARHVWWNTKSNSLYELNVHLGWLYTCFVKADLIHNLDASAHQEMKLTRQKQALALQEADTSDVSLPQMHRVRFASASCQIEMHQKSWCETTLVRAFNRRCTQSLLAPKVHVYQGVKPDTKFASLICRLPKVASDVSLRASPPTLRFFDVPQVHKQISDIMSHFDIDSGNKINLTGESEVDPSTYGVNSTDNTDTLAGNFDEAVTQRVKIFRPWIFLGELPLMTKRGHFILNGSPRVIVNQMARCPGIYFQEKRRGVGFEQEVRVSADLIPQRGPWLRIQSDWEGRFWARLKREGRVKYATLYEAFQEFEKQYNAPLVSLVTNSSSSFPKSEILAFQERKVKEDRQKKALIRFFKNSTRYSLGKQGRLRINQRVHSSQSNSYGCRKQLLLAHTYGEAERGIDSVLPQVQVQNFATPLLSTNQNHSVNTQNAHQVIEDKRRYNRLDWLYVQLMQKSFLLSIIDPRLPPTLRSFATHTPSVHSREVSSRENNSHASLTSVDRSVGGSGANGLEAPMLGYTIKEGHLLKNKEKNLGGVYLGQPWINDQQYGVSARKDNEELHKFWSSFFSNRTHFKRLTNLLCIENVRQFISLKKPNSNAIFALNSNSNLLGKLTAILSTTELISCNPICSPKMQQAETKQNAIASSYTSDVSLRASSPTLRSFDVPQKHCANSETSLHDAPSVQRCTSKPRFPFSVEKEFAILSDVPNGAIKSTDNVQSIESRLPIVCIPSVLPAVQYGNKNTFHLGDRKNSVDHTEHLLMAADVNAIHLCLEHLLEGQGFTDDIDHLKNRLVRTSGKLLQQQLELGLDRLSEVMTPLLGNLIQGQLLSSLLPSQLGDKSSLHQQKSPQFSDADKMQKKKKARKEKKSHDPYFAPTGHARVTSPQFVVYDEMHSRSSASKMHNHSLKPIVSFSTENGKSNLQQVKNTGNQISFSTESGEKEKQVRNVRSASFLKQPSSKVNALDKKRSASGKPRDQISSDRTSPPTLRFFDVPQVHMKEGVTSSSPENSARRNGSLQQTPFRWLRTSKPVNNAFREFFGSNPLSQYMDQTNPLAEITHKRRLSSMGPGGIKRETAGMEVRGIHPTHYGRVCPIETPEGKNAGLVNSPTVYGRIGQNGFMETPLYQVVESQVQKERWAFFSAQQEENEESSLATGDTGVTRFNFLSHGPIPVQTANNPLAHFQQVERHRVGYKALSPVQTISIATALIPFLEHDDANRALMGSNMQRQAIPLLSPERPIVGTGFEPIVMSESGQAIQATKMGCVSHVSADKIILESIHSTWEAPTTVRSRKLNNPNTPSDVSLLAHAPEVQVSASCKARVHRAKKMQEVGYSKIQNGDSISNIYCKFFYTRKKYNNVWWNRTVFTRCLEPPFLFKVGVSTQHKIVLASRWDNKENNLMFRLMQRRGWNVSDMHSAPLNQIYDANPKESPVHNRTQSFSGASHKSLGNFSKKVIKPEVQIRFLVKRRSRSGEIGENKKKIGNLMKLIDDNNIYNQLILDNEQTNSFLQMPLVLYHRRRTAGFSEALEMQLSLRSAWKIHNQRCKQRFRLLQSMGSCISDVSLLALASPPTFHYDAPAVRRLCISDAEHVSASRVHRSEIPEEALFLLRGWQKQTTFIRDVIHAQIYFGAPAVQRSLLNFWSFLKLFCETRKNSRGFKVGNHLVSESDYVECHLPSATLWHVKNPSWNSFLNSFTKSPNFQICWENITDSFLHSHSKFVSLPCTLALQKAEVHGAPKVQKNQISSNISLSASRCTCIEDARSETSEMFHYNALARTSNQYIKDVKKEDALVKRPRVCTCIGDARSETSEEMQVQVQRCIQNLHISKQLRLRTATNLHLCSTQSALLFKKVEQSLQLYQRSNQETCLSQRPLVREGDWVQKGDFLADCSASHSGDLALGKNVTVAYMPWEGYNFEDAIVISDRLVANDIYTSIHIERYEIKVSKNSQGKERITNQIPSLSSQHLKHLDSSGIARVSSWVQPGDILVGKVVELKRPLSPYERLAWELASRLSPNSPEREKWLSKVWLEDISLRLPAGVCGRVINFQIISTEWSEKEHSLIPLEVHVYLAVKRKIQVGDKLAGRHGNKGIVSIVLPRQDMPYLGDGSSVDMVLNPLGVPSRMNLGQIFECLLGLAGSQLGCNFKVTPFDEIAGGEASRSLVFLKLYQCRLIYKQQWLFTPTFPGKNKLFDGRTGEPFENWVTVGQAYMLKLIHMVDHKIHARSTGPYSLFTRQPVRGRSRRGGQRLGEMEVWAVEGFGAAYTLQEFLTIKSDDLKARAALQRSFYKKNDVTLGKVHISPGNPEAFRVLVSELQALCLHIQM